MKENEIKLLRNNDNRTDSDLEWITEFYEFLQGKSPGGINDGKPMIKLTPKKAFSVIWYLQEHFSILPDGIEKCSNCDSLYDSHCSGLHWESKGKFYCDGCTHLVPTNYDRGKK